MSKEYLKDLLDKYATGRASASERKEFLDLLHETGRQAELERLIDESFVEFGGGEMGDSETLELIYQQIMLAREPGENGKVAELIHLEKRRLNWWWAAAAIAIIVLGIGGFYFIIRNSKKEIPVATTQRFKNDVNPGKFKAILTLGDGKKIIIDSAAGGELARQGSVSVSNSNGQLVYKGETSNVKGEMLYNTLSTERGETYATILSDGSKVWLNSASSIKFPVVFGTSERRVEITGEAYFEVAKNVAKPFIVSVNGMEVQVLGTRFDINAYSDEPAIKTTLLEGSVKVSKGSSNTTLIPGQQASMNSSGNINVASDVDVEKITSWKNNLFIFSGDDIETVMRQISRWYDIEVQYKDQISDRHFTGIISRNNNVSEVLKMLEATGKIKFEIEGRKISVMK